MRRLLLLAALAAGSLPAAAQDAETVVRLGRLESQMRAMAGQIEQLQFQNRKLEEQLRKFQGDVEYRFQELKPQPRPTATPVSAPAPAATAAPARPRTPAAPAVPAAQGAAPKPRQP